jgi:hypothetical protein
MLDELLGRDEYLLLADYDSYVDCQQQVDAAFADSESWTRKSILTVARMGAFRPTAPFANTVATSGASRSSTATSASCMSQPLRRPADQRAHPHDERPVHRVASGSMAIAGTRSPTSAISAIGTR